MDPDNGYELSHGILLADIFCGTLCEMDLRTFVSGKERVYRECDRVTCRSVEKNRIRTGSPISRTPRLPLYGYACVGDIRIEIQKQVYNSPERVENMGIGCAESPA